MPELAEMVRTKDQLIEEVAKFWDTVGDRDVTRDEKTQVMDKNKEIEQLEVDIADREQTEGLRAKAYDRRAGIANSRTSDPPVQPNRDDSRPPAPSSLGDVFLNSAEWTDYVRTIAPGGRAVTNNTKVNSPKLLIPGLGFKNLVTGASATSGGAFIVPDQSGIYDPLGRKVLTLRDLISVRTTSRDSVDYVRQTSRVNAAAFVPEATSESGSSGAKPWGGMAFERKNAPVGTVAELVAATKNALSDAGEMRGIIDGELRADLQEAVEDVILNGSGLLDEPEGLDTVSGTQDQAWSSNILETTRKARTKVRTVGRATPTGYVFYPTDWETIDLTQDNEARYFFGGPMVMGTPRLWGLPVVESEFATAGWGWVGDWRRAVLWDREQTTIDVSDSHADFFERNLVAIRAEMRIAFAVIRPAAFVEIDLTA